MMELSVHVNPGRAGKYFCIVLILLSMMLSDVSAGYAMVSGVTSTQWFKPIPTSLMSNDTAELIWESIGNETGGFNLHAWTERGMLVRSGGEDLYCLGNLTWALINTGPLKSAEYSDAAGTLALLPTAGVLIGTPSKELWLLFKLMPLAGALTMLISLGGPMMPDSASDYNLERLTYGGLVPTTRQNPRTPSWALSESKPTHLAKAEHFGQRVATRAEDQIEGSRYQRIWIMLFFQLVFFVAILVVLWFGQRGSIIEWWCRVSFDLSHDDRMESS